MWLMSKQNAGSVLWQLSFAWIGLLNLKFEWPPPALVMEGGKYIKESSD